MIIEIDTYMEFIENKKGKKGYARLHILEILFFSILKNIFYPCKT
jgi:hypothetical protein